MKTQITVAFAMFAGVVIGAIGVHSLHAQGKPKAYIVTENEVVDAAALAEYMPLDQAAQRSAGGRAFGTGGGKIVGLVGEPPKRVGISEWDSLDQAVAFRQSDAFKTLEPQRTKALKTVRSYIVEAVR